MVLVYLFRFLAVMVFAYMVWRKSRDDLNEDVNSFLWSCIVAFFIGGRIGWGFANLLNWGSDIWDWLFFWDRPGFNILVGFVSLFSFVFLYSLFERWSFVELSEDLLMPTIFTALLWIVSDWFLMKDSSVFLFGASFVVVFLASFWARNYRSFYWYRSGKKGFMFLFSGLLFSLLTIGISYMIDIWVFYRYLALVFGLIFGASLVMLGELINLDRRKNETKK